MATTEHTNSSEPERETLTAAGPALHFTIFHSTLGLLLGTSAGVLFWSGDEEPGCGAAVCYPTPEMAISVVDELNIRSLVKPTEQLLLRYVVPDIEEESGTTFASVSACLASGLPGWISPWTAQKEMSKTRRAVVVH